MYRIIYNGIERADFFYYLACIVAANSNKILVNDISKSHDLYNSVTRESEEPVYEWKNIIFTKGVNAETSKNEIEAMNIDFYLEYRGLTVINSKANDYENTLHLIMPDYTQSGLNLSRKIQPEGDYLYILRDMCTKKITNRSFALGAEIPIGSIVGSLPLNTLDMASYVTLTINGHHKFGKLSENMDESLLYMTRKIFDVNEKDAKKIVKKAKRIR